MQNLKSRSNSVMNLLQKTSYIFEEAQLLVRVINIVIRLIKRICMKTEVDEKPKQLINK